MPSHMIYYGATVQDGVLVPSTGEVILSFQSNARTVRGTTTPDGRQLFSVFEFMNLVCVESGGWAADEWRQLKQTGLKKEIRQMKTGRVDADLAEMVDVKVKKHSKYKYIYVSQPAMTVRGLQWLLAQLGDRVGEFFQVVAAGVFAGYLAGARGMVHAGVASLKVVSKRTLNRRERAGGAEAEAEGPAKRQRVQAAVAVVPKRDRTLSQRTLAKLEAAKQRLEAET